MYVKVKDSVISVYKLLQPNEDLGILCSVHYVTSACFFLFLSVVPITFDIAKSPIVCLTGMPEKSEAFKKAVESYCYITGKFTYEWRSDFANDVEQDLPEFGDRARNNHGYYVWVSAVLFLCFASTAIGRIVYTELSGNLLGDMVKHLKLVKVLRGSKKKKEKEESAEETEDSMVGQILSFERLEIDAVKWTLSFLLLEACNWLTVFGQIYLIDILLKGKFLYLGFYVLDEVILNMIFPKQVKCDFYTFGPSGTLQNHDILCILVNNLANEKIFLAAWFWLAFMSAISCLAFARRIVSMICYRNTSFNSFYWRITRFTGPKRSKMLYLAISKHLSFCQWLFLTYVNDNSEPYVFQEWLNSLGQQLGVKMTERNKDYEAGDVTPSEVTGLLENSPDGTQENSSDEDEENDSTTTVLIHNAPAVDNTIVNFATSLYSSIWDSVTSLLFPPTGIPAGTATDDEIELDTVVSADDKIKLDTVVSADDKIKLDTVVSADDKIKLDTVVSAEPSSSRSSPISSSSRLLKK